MERKHASMATQAKLSCAECCIRQLCVMSRSLQLCEHSGTSANNCPRIRFGCELQGHHLLHHGQVSCQVLVDRACKVYSLLQGWIFDQCCTLTRAWLQSPSLLVGLAVRLPCLSTPLASGNLPLTRHMLPSHTT